MVKGRQAGAPASRRGQKKPQEVVARGYPSSGLFRLALAAAERARLDPLESIVAEILAAVALEAFLRDLIDALAAVKEDDTPNDLLLAADRLRLLDRVRASVAMKLEILNETLQQPPLPKCSPDYENLRRLIEIRNLLVHKQPEVVYFPLPEAPSRESELAKFLVGRGLMMPPFQRDINSPSTWLARREVAVWACATAKGAARGILDAFPDCGAKERLQHFFNADLYAELDYVRVDGTLCERARIEKPQAEG
jgi:hypothetical protein